VHLIDGSEEARDDRRNLVGDGAELGGGEERRRGCSGKGSTAGSGGIASRGHGKANKGVRMVGVGLWWWVGGGQRSPE